MKKASACMIHAVAMSPDSNTIACGGHTGWSWGQSCVFSRETGTLIGLSSGMPKAINYLAFSGDGRYLADALRGNGIRVFRSSDCRQIGEDVDYGGPCHGLDFDARNRLATSCCNGVRLYESLIVDTMTPTLKKRGTGGELFLQFRFPQMAPALPWGLRITQRSMCCLPISSRLPNSKTALPASEPVS